MKQPTTYLVEYKCAAYYPWQSPQQWTRWAEVMYLPMAESIAARCTAELGLLTRVRPIVNR